MTSYSDTGCLNLLVLAQSEVFQVPELPKVIEVRLVLVENIVAEYGRTSRINDILIITVAYVVRNIIPQSKYMDQGNLSDRHRRVLECYRKILILR